MSVRAIRFASPEHQSREINAIHEHHADGWSYYGTGRTVLVVCKRPGKGRRIICDVHGEDGSNVWGGEFVYADYFLPEELKKDAA